jgi:hypothetical protein
MLFWNEKLLITCFFNPERHVCRRKCFPENMLPGGNASRRTCFPEEMLPGGHASRRKCFPEDMLPGGNVTREVFLGLGNNLRAPSGKTL